MKSFLLWFSIFAFTLFTASTISTLARYVSSKSSILFQYLLLKLFFGLWLIVYTYALFTELFIEPLSAPQQNIVALLRMFISAFVLYITPVLSIRLKGNIVSLKKKVLLLIAPASYAISVFFLLTTPAMGFFAWVIILYYIYLIFFAIYAVTTPSASLPITNRLILYYFRYTVPAYFILLPTSLHPIFPLPEVWLNFLAVSPRAAYCTGWALMDIIIYFFLEYSHETKRVEAIPLAFIKDFGITEREQDIITLMIRGKSSSAIGEDLFISPRTVETHMYNIYRKCSVKNKMALFNLLRSYE